MKQCFFTFTYLYRCTTTTKTVCGALAQIINLHSIKYYLLILAAVAVFIVIISFWAFWSCLRRVWRSGSSFSCLLSCRRHDAGRSCSWRCVRWGLCRVLRTAWISFLHCGCALRCSVKKWKMSEICIIAK